jgi:hypothetical protein
LVGLSVYAQALLAQTVLTQDRPIALHLTNVTADRIVR